MNSESLEGKPAIESRNDALEGHDILELSLEEMHYVAGGFAKIKVSYNPVD